MVFGNLPVPSFLSEEGPTPESSVKFYVNLLYILIYRLLFVKLKKFFQLFYVLFTEEDSIPVPRSNLPGQPSHLQTDR